MRREEQFFISLFMVFRFWIEVNIFFEFRFLPNETKLSVDADCTYSFSLAPHTTPGDTHANLSQVKANLIRVVRKSVEITIFNG